MSDAIIDFSDGSIIPLLESFLRQTIPNGFEEYAKMENPELLKTLKEMVAIYSKPATNRRLASAVNVDKRVRDAIAEIFGALSKKYKMVLGGGTALAILGYVDRKSEDIDIMVDQKDFKNVCSDFESIFGVKLNRSPVGNSSCVFKSVTKVEIVPYEPYKLANTMRLSDVPVETMSMEIALDNKIHAGIDRKESRDIYDLAMFRVKMGASRFYAKAGRNALRYAERIALCKNDEKLMRVLKHKRLDLLLLDAFEKDLKRYVKNSSRMGCI